MIFESGDDGVRGGVGGDDGVGHAMIAQSCGGDGADGGDGDFVLQGGK